MCVCIYMFNNMKTIATMLTKIAKVVWIKSMRKSKISVFFSVVLIYILYVSPHILYCNALLPTLNL